MFGETFRCSDCDFEFVSGWSHHDGGSQRLICRECATYFSAQGSSSCWGPQPHERLQVFRYRYVKRRKQHVPEPTDLFVQVSAAGPAASPEGVFRLSSEALLPLTCPSCHHSGSIVETLSVGEPCPKCHQGVVEHRGHCIY